MKIVEIGIDEYGQLKQQSYTFIDKQLNIIFGMNEAGKSTIFHFIETILFGFSRKKQEIELYKSSHLNQYGGYCVLQLDETVYIKVTRYYKQNKALPTVSKLIKQGEQFAVYEEQQLKQDEFEQLYLSGLSRKMFRDLCALTLDELQATSMKDDEQLNQHLYHATWESSKLIAQLIKKSEDIVTSLYRPKGTKQTINMLTEQLKQVKQKRFEMENELEAYESIQQRLTQLQHEQHACQEQLTEAERKLQLLAKIEVDYPLYEQYNVLHFDQSKLVFKRQADAGLRHELEHYINLREETLPRLRELEERKRQLMLELTGIESDVNSTLLDEQKQMLEQFAMQSAIIEENEAKREQLKRLDHFITQRAHIGHITIDRQLIVDQNWSIADKEQLKQFEELEQQTSRQLLLVRTQIKELEQKLAYTKEQVKWLTSQIQSNEASETERFVFIPKQLDELMRAEASYDESYRRHSLLEDEQAEQGLTRTSKLKQYKMPRTLLILCIVVVLIAVALLVSQLNVVNITLSVVMLATVLFLLLLESRKSMEAKQQATIASHRQANLSYRAALKQLLYMPELNSDTFIWSNEHDYSLRQALHHYKDKLKKLEQLKHSIAAHEQDIFDMTYTLQMFEQQHADLLAETEAKNGRWQKFLEENGLPIEAKIDAVKAFMHDVDSIKHNIETYEQTLAKFEQDEQRLGNYFAKLQQLTSHSNEVNQSNICFVHTLLKQKYDKHLQSFNHQRQLQHELEQLNVQLSLLEAPLQKLEASIRHTYSHLNETTLEMWQQWINVEQEWQRYDVDMFKLEQKRRIHVTEQHMNELNALYEAQSYADLLVLQQQHDQHYEINKKELSALIEEKGQLQERLRSLSSTFERQQLAIQEAMLEEQLQQSLRQYTKFALMEYVIKTTRSQYEAEHQPLLMQQASAYIAKLTAGKYTKIVLHPETKTFELATSELKLVPIERLSRGTAELVYFSLRLALLTTHEVLRQAPLILDDPFVNFDIERQQRVISFIQELTGHRQIVLLTCHKHIVDLIQKQEHHSALISL